MPISSLALIGGGARAFTANAGLALKPDPNGILDLPDGFSYTVVSETGGAMSDGFFRPGRPDGMACFPYSNDATRCILVRNHENWLDSQDGGAFGADDALAANLAPSKIYDYKVDGRPFIGGVTNAIYNLKEKRLERDFLTLAGTVGNCAGGATPWGSWLSCEESAVTPADGAQKHHGFVFEVPARALGPVDAIPIKAMGRFTHEAAAVDPDTDIVYMTEDSVDGLFYRFLPARRKELMKGGRLQALAIRGWKSADTLNWPRDHGSAGAGGVGVGQDFEVDWIDLDAVESPDGDLRLRGFAAGAARFCRGEGMAYGRRGQASSAEIFFNCTQGGAARAGQVWRYKPSPSEGRREEKNAPGTLALIFESPSHDVLDLCDNIAVSPTGELILCEDSRGDQYLRGLTPDGRIYDIARNAHAARSEFCGACFSPDGSIMFVNTQSPGMTFAIEGPWRTLKV